MRKALQLAPDEESVDVLQELFLIRISCFLNHRNPTSISEEYRLLGYHVSNWAIPRVADSQVEVGLMTCGSCYARREWRQILPP